MRYYPLDEQKCELTFASWSQEVTKVLQKILNTKPFFLVSILFQLDLLLGKSISRKKILNMYTTSKEFELRDFEGNDIILQILNIMLYYNSIALFIINTAYWGLFFREKRRNIWPLLWGKVCQCDLHNPTMEVSKTKYEYKYTNTTLLHKFANVIFTIEF